MTKIIIATHGPLADGLKETAKMFFLEQSEDIHAVGLFPQESPTDLLNKLKEILNQNNKEEFLFLVDMFGGTPFNTVSLLMEEYDTFNIQCFTGVNMPILMEILSNYKNSSLDELVKLIGNVAGDSVINVREFLEIGM